MKSPKLYLTIDNCFAYKRWARPSEWMKVVAECGVNYVEASADTEVDPLYTTPEYMKDWVEDYKRISEETGVKIGTFYSGHGTYTCTALTNPDKRIRDHFRYDWMNPMMATAKSVDAGVGWYFQAITHDELQDPDLYKARMAQNYQTLAEITEDAKKMGVKFLSLEQMYTPNQPPWTIADSTDLIKYVKKNYNQNLYLTVDTGHMYGQKKFLRPTDAQIIDYLKASKEGYIKEIWLGQQINDEIFEKALKAPESEWGKYIAEINANMDKTPHLFAQPIDSDIYAWLEQLGAYSPIVHLQQTNGNASAHLPFTPETNKTGIVTGEKVIEALRKSFAADHGPDMPDKCEEIYMTIELFAGTAEMNRDIKHKIKQTVEYWRQFIPRDGMTLDEVKI